MNGETKVLVSPTYDLNNTEIFLDDIGGNALFFRRLDYLLGQSPTWMTWDQYEDDLDKHPTGGKY